MAKSTRAQLKNKPLAFKKDLKNYINRFNLGHCNEARRALEWVGDYSSSESYTDSDSDYDSDTNSIPDTNYQIVTTLSLILNQSQSQSQIKKYQNLKQIHRIQTNKKQKIRVDNAL